MTGLQLRQRISDEVDGAGVNSNLFSTLGDHMVRYLLQSRSDNTINNYFGAFRRFEQFIVSCGGTAIPTEPIHVALYLTKLLDNGSSHSVVQTAFYAIEWAHDLNNFEDPTNNSFVKNLLESSKRQIHKPKIKKDTIPHNFIIDLCEKYKDCIDLGVIRDLAMIVLCYAGFLRYSEVSGIKSDHVKFIENSHIEIHLEKSKTDQYRLGDSVVIAKGQSAACPFLLLKKYFSLAGIHYSTDSVYIFRPMFRSGNKNALIYKNKPLSYTRTRECIVTVVN